MLGVLTTTILFPLRTPEYRQQSPHETSHLPILCIRIPFSCSLCHLTFSIHDCSSSTHRRPPDRPPVALPPLVLAHYCRYMTHFTPIPTAPSFPTTVSPRVSLDGRVPLLSRGCVSRTSERACVCTRATCTRGRARTSWTQRVRLGSAFCCGGVGVRNWAETHSETATAPHREVRAGGFTAGGIGYVTPLNARGPAHDTRPADAATWIGTTGWLKLSLWTRPGDRVSDPTRNRCGPPLRP